MDPRPWGGCGEGLGGGSPLSNGVVGTCSNDATWWRMLDCRVLISCGNEVEEYRNLAQDCIKRLSQMLVYDLNVDVVIR